MVRQKVKEPSKIYRYPDLGYFLNFLTGLSMEESRIVFSLKYRKS